LKKIDFEKMFVYTSFSFLPSKSQSSFSFYWKKEVKARGVGSEQQERRTYEYVCREREIGLPIF